MSDYSPWFDWQHPINSPAPSQRRISIAELEAILQREDDVAIEILPNGEIRETGQVQTGRKPLTMRENLGGEYGAAA